MKVCEGLVLAGWQASKALDVGVGKVAALVDLAGGDVLLLRLTPALVPFVVVVAVAVAATWDSHSF